MTGGDSFLGVAGLPWSYPFTETFIVTSTGFSSLTLSLFLGASSTTYESADILPSLTFSENERISL